jgi:glutamate/tyrosine decarboxylase-like PLP-dependent enzyme
MFEHIAQEPELEPLTCDLSIATFRYLPPDVTPGTPEGEDYLNRLNGELCERLQTGGEAFVSNAVIEGKFALRACIVNFRTSEEDVRALPGTVVRAGRALHNEMQGR